MLVVFGSVILALCILNRSLVRDEEERPEDFGERVREFGEELRVAKGC